MGSPTQPSTELVATHFPVRAPQSKEPYRYGGRVVWRDPHDHGGPSMTAPHLSVWPADTREGFRRSEVSALVGRGEDTWRRTAADLLRWKVKTRSGFRVEDDRPATAGAELVVTVRVLGVVIREPIQVVEVVDTEDRVGYSYRTLPGHPVSGEEAFIVHREGDRILVTVRSLTRPSPQQPWRALFPLLQVAQLVVRRRYLRALTRS